MTHVIALVVAAGSGLRMGGELPKQFCRSPASRCLAALPGNFAAHRASMA